MPANHICVHEERFAHIESEIAETNARLESKKEDIKQIQNDKDEQNKLQVQLIEKVTRVTVLLEQSQKQREESKKNNDKKFDDIEEKIDALTSELGTTKTELTDFVASQRSFRNTVAIGAPIIISIIVGVIFKFI